MGMFLLFKNCSHFLRQVRDSVVKLRIDVTFPLKLSVLKNECLLQCGSIILFDWQDMSCWLMIWNFIARGHSITTWIKFFQILTPQAPGSSGQKWTFYFWTKPFILDIFRLLRPFWNCFKINGILIIIKFKFTPSFCFPNVIPDDVTATTIYPLLCDPHGLSIDLHPLLSKYLVTECPLTKKLAWITLQQKFPLKKIVIICLLCKWSVRRTNHFFRTVNSNLPIRIL